MTYHRPNARAVKRLLNELKSGKEPKKMDIFEIRKSVERMMPPNKGEGKGKGKGTLEEGHMKHATFEPEINEHRYR